MIEFALALAIPLILASSPAGAVCPAVNVYPFEPGCPLPADELNKALGGSGGITNPVDYDPLCGGQTTAASITVTPPTAHDCTDAINLAASTLINGRRAKVRLQTGLYYVTDTILLDGSQVMEGDGKGSSVIRVRDTFEPTAVGIIRMGATDLNAGVGETLRDLMVDFDQPQFPSGARAGFALLGTCTSIPGGTGCKYPPAVFMIPGARNNFINLRIQKAWDGISGDNTHNGAAFGTPVIHIYNVEMSALNAGLWLDGSADQSIVTGYYFQSFGMSSTAVGSLYAVMTDGDTDCMRIGEQDGALFSNVFCHRTAIRLIASVVGAGTAGLVGEWSNISLDGASLIVEHNKHLEISSFGASGGVGTFPCTVDIRGGQTSISNYGQSAAIPATVSICVSAGTLNINGGQIISAAPDNPATCPAPDPCDISQETAVFSGGTSRIRNMHFGNPPDSNRLVPMIKKTGGTLIMIGNSISPHGTGTGVALESSDDDENDFYSNNDFGGWPVSLGCGIATAGWCSGTTLGYYDIPDYRFAFAAATPAFATMGDFVASGVVQSGGFWLRGNMAEYRKYYEFVATHTTAAGAFSLTMAMPTPFGTAVPECSFTRHEMLVIAAGTKIDCQLEGTTPTTHFTFYGTASAAQRAAMGVVQFPTGAANPYKLGMTGRYQIR